MSALLAVHASPRLGGSVSRTLAARFIGHWTAAHPGGTVRTRDLTATRLPFVDLSWMGGAFLRPELGTPAMEEAIRGSDELVDEIVAADHVLTGTPMFNFSIPAALKAYIDQIVRVGLTISPRYEGLLGGRKATVILASGSVYAAGTRGEGLDAAGTYLRQILGFLGIVDVAVVHAGGGHGREEPRRLRGAVRGPVVGGGPRLSAVGSSQSRVRLRRRRDGKALVRAYALEESRKNTRR